MNEWIIVGVIALLVLLFGARKLPELARGVGRTRTEYRRGLEEDYERKHALPIEDDGYVDPDGRPDPGPPEHYLKR